ncbi:hypothetical protein BaRGS_00003608 [Batillaria attramentaria]|uniref:Uncharacterized protein n=1 Tax=Batillaria attramentaria TaxID=370345 RepID=A0ABD0M162_9CAEN
MEEIVNTPADQVPVPSARGQDGWKCAEGELAAILRPKMFSAVGVTQTAEVMPVLNCVHRAAQKTRSAQDSKSTRNSFLYQQKDTF